VSAPPARAQSIVIDHNDLARFGTLTAQQISAAAAARTLFVDRSVGANTSSGLTSLARSDSRFSRTNITFYGWPRVMPAPNVSGCTGWNGLWTGYQPCFTSWVTPRLSQYRIVSFWFDYLTGVWTANPLANYFTSANGSFDARDYLAWRTSRPTVRSFAWTTSLPYSDGNMPGLLARLDAFNVQMRAWAPANNQPLLDAADILSTDANGRLCLDPSTNKPRICQAYAGDWQQGGGHLNAAGQLRMAKAFWLMLVALTE
jgi:hypothetical protein